MRGAGKRRRSARVGHSAASEWQLNSLWRAALALVLFVAALAFSFPVTYACFEAIAGVVPVGSGRVVVPGVTAMAALVVMVVVAPVYWRAYARGYDIREQPVETPVRCREPGGWVSIPSSGVRVPRDLAGRAAAYESEFFLTALVHPRSVFARISEHVKPGRRMLDREVDFEVVAPGRRGLRVLGKDDVEVKHGSEGVSPCNLVVPVTFIRRGALAIGQSVENSAGTSLPVIKQSELSEGICRIVREYLEGRRPPGDDGFSEWCRGALEALGAYLRSTSPNESTAPAELVAEAMYRRAATDEDRIFCKDVLEMLVGLRDVIPVCVSVHAAAVDEPQIPRRGLASGRAFRVRLREKMEMEPKPSSALPNPSGNHAIGLLNRLLDRAGRRDDTVYYSVAHASRSTSYHLYVKGPEGTYYARGSLLRDDPRDKREIYAEQVGMQRRCGQRDAHLYVRAGHRMANTAFMFRCRKAPLDTYHIMFVATLLCTAVLVMCAVSGVRPSLGSGPSFATMILAVVSAAGGWIYARASDGRDESRGIQLSVVAMVACSVVGMVLHVLLTGGDSGQEGTEAAAPAWAIALWSALVAVMEVNTALVGFAALLHTALYHRLVSKPLAAPAGTGGAEGARRPAEVRDGMRMDTPQGKRVPCDYALWCRSIREFWESCGLSYGGGERLDV